MQNSSHTCLYTDMETAPKTQISRFSSITLLPSPPSAQSAYPCNASVCRRCCSRIHPPCKCSSGIALAITILETIRSSVYRGIRCFIAIAPAMQTEHIFSYRITLLSFLSPSYHHSPEDAIFSTVPRRISRWPGPQTPRSPLRPLCRCFPETLRPLRTFFPDRTESPECRYKSSP